MPEVTYNGYLQSITFIFILSDDSAEIIFVQLKKAEFMRSTFKVLFYLKRTKSTPRAVYPVMGRITVNGTTEFKAQSIRAAVDSQLPITFSDPVLEVRRQALIGGSDTPAKPTIKKPGVGPVGHVPPAARQGRLRTLSQIEALHIEGAMTPARWRPPSASSRRR